MSLGTDDVRLLATLFQTDDALVQATMRTAWGAIPRADDAVDSLIKLLKHEKTVVRSRAADALGEMPYAPKRAVPALREACNDTDESVRREAKQSLSLIESATEDRTDKKPCDL